MHMSNLKISSVCLAGQLSCLARQKLNVEHFSQNFLLNYFIPAMVTGTIDLYHVIPLSVALVLTEVHKISRRQNCWVRFLTHCSTVCQSVVLG